MQSEIRVFTQERGGEARDGGIQVSPEDKESKTKTF